MMHEISRPNERKKVSDLSPKRTIAIWNWFLLYQAVRSIPSRLVRSACYDSSRTQVYAYVTVNGSSLRKKTVTTDRRHDLFGTLVRSPKQTPARESSSKQETQRSGPRRLVPRERGDGKISCSSQHDIYLFTQCA